LQRARVVWPQAKRFLLAAAIGLFAEGAAFAGLTSPELKITSGATSTTVTGAFGGVVYSNGDFAGWDIILTAGSSNSPGLAPVYGLALGSLSAECILQAGCANLDIELSDSGFTQAAFLQTSYGAADAGSSASTTQSAYESTSNADFAETTLIGTVGPFNGTGAFSGSAGGTVPGGTPYSLTIDDEFAGCSSAHCAGYATGGDIATPEPSTFALLGTGLFGFAALFRRKRMAKPRATRL